MKELDLLLTRYLRESWPSASAAERLAFEAFLELPDPQIAAYLVGSEPAQDSVVQQLIGELRNGRRP
jgi:succinate dehydrogenase flavin-adding protein (antitoxin of CptAB toxin-antitoxin module)